MQPAEASAFFSGALFDEFERQILSRDAMASPKKKFEFSFSFDEEDSLQPGDPSASLWFVLIL